MGAIKNVTVSRRGEKWDVSIQTEYEVSLPAANPSEIGIDMGVKRFVTMSNGDFVEPLNPFKQEREKLAKLQRKLARQKKGSRNSTKTKRKIARLHRYIADSRRDFLHKTSTKIAKNHSIVYVEDLKVSNMSASAGGTKESSGKNVRQKSGLNRSILDQGWYSFFQMLSYKLERRGGKLIKVDPKNTSRTCPRCGLVSAENRKSQATFACIGCGYRSNADEVGAINILMGRTGPVSLWYEWCSKAAVSRNPKRPAAALGYGRCRGGMESLSFMTRRMSKEAVVLWNARCKGLISTFEEETNKEEPNGSFMFPPPHNGLQTPQNRLTQKY